MKIYITRRYKYNYTALLHMYNLQAHNFHKLVNPLNLDDASLSAYSTNFYDYISDCCVLNFSFVRIVQDNFVNDNLLTGNMEFKKAA